MPEGAARPLTKVELLELTAPLRNLPPSDEGFYKATEALTATIRNTYGKYAPDVLRQVATRGGLNMEASEVFADEVYRASPTRKGGKMIDLSSDAARADYAMDLARTADTALLAVTGASNQPSARAIQVLKANADDPQVVADFDAKFGAGMAARVLKK